MLVHSQSMLVGRVGHSQLILVENRDDCRSGRFQMQVATDSHGLNLLSQIAPERLPPLVSGGVEAVLLRRG